MKSMILINILSINDLERIEYLTESSRVIT